LFIRTPSFRSQHLPDRLDAKLVIENRSYSIATSQDTRLNDTFSEQVTERKLAWLRKAAVSSRRKTKLASAAFRASLTLFIRSFMSPGPSCRPGSWLAKLEQFLFLFRRQEDRLRSGFRSILTSARWRPGGLRLSDGGCGLAAGDSI